MTEMPCESFDLLVEPSSAEYRATVLDSPAGQASALFPLPAIRQEDLDLGKFDLHIARDLGRTLFDTVFDGEMLTCLRRSLDEARRKNAALRIRLRLTNVPELASLPWEYLYDSTLERFLALSEETLFVRYLHLPVITQSLLVEPPVKMLVVTASPRDYPPLDAEREWRMLNEVLFDGAHRGRIELVRLETPSLAALGQQLEGDEYHVLHFVGHGGFDEHVQDGILILEDERGSGHAVHRERLGTLLHDHRSLRLVFLNACQGARASRSDAFAGMAQGLVQQGVPVVIAMQFAVTDEAAITLIREFYRALGDGHPVDASLTKARKALSLLENTAEWGTPVLFSRLGNNQLLARPARPAVVRRDFEPEMVYIPSGKFLMGSKPGKGVPDEETDQHIVDLPPYWIGKYPVTNREYAAFLRRNYREEYRPVQAGWFLEEPPLERMDHPVVSISWHDARAYCDWLSRETGRTYRLPTEAEWEKAARGTDGRVYPWGNDWVDGRCTPITESGDTTPVIEKAKVEAREDQPYYPEGGSPYDCHDTVGNVQEWTSTLWGGSEHRNEYPYPYVADEREDPEVGAYPRHVYRVYRGGFLETDRGQLRERDRLRCAARGRSDHSTEVIWRGFRVVCEV